MLMTTPERRAMYNHLLPKGFPLSVLYKLEDAYNAGTCDMYFIMNIFYPYTEAVKEFTILEDN